MTGVDRDLVAVVVVRDGRVPAGADEAVAEAAGAAVVVGSGAGPAVIAGLPSAAMVWWAETPTSPARLAGLLAGVLGSARLVILPASPDGRDLAPRLAARMGRPLLSGAVRVELRPGGPVADLLRAEGRVVVPVSTGAAAVATLWPGARSAAPTPVPHPTVEPLGVSREGAGFEVPDAVETVALVAPDPATMDLADAPRVLAGGAGLVPEGADDSRARAIFALLVDVATAVGASAGATRVVTDAGWMGYERQIGTTGVAVNPQLYVALGVSGASQHIGGIGDPHTVVSVNLDPACPMTGRADLGLVADAPALLTELAGRLGVPVPPDLQEDG